MQDNEQPKWLQNADKVVSKPKKKKATRQKGLKEQLEEEKLTIIVDNLEDRNVIDIEEDGEDEWQHMRHAAEGRILSKSGRTMREAFALEFLVDFNGIAAATRIGAKDPVSCWRRFAQCAYTQRLISKQLKEWEGSTVITRNAIIAKYWAEANDYIHGTSTSRVNATTKLAEMLGYKVDTININANSSAEFLEAPLQKQEFIEMKEAFDEEY